MPSGAELLEPMLTATNATCRGLRGNSIQPTSAAWRCTHALRRVSGSLKLMPADMHARQQCSHMVGITRTFGLAHLNVGAALVRWKLMTHVLASYLVMVITSCRQPCMLVQSQC